MAVTANKPKMVSGVTELRKQQGISQPFIIRYFAITILPLFIKLPCFIQPPSQTRYLNDGCALLRSKATDERLCDLRDRIARDVRTSWLNANTANQRLAVTQQLLEQANLALNLAQSRYNLGLASIVELSQAQLQQTQAQISNVGAGYDYQLALAALQYQTSGI